MAPFYFLVFLKYYLLENAQKDFLIHQLSNENDIGKSWLLKGKTIQGSPHMNVKNEFNMNKRNIRYGLDDSQLTV